MQPLTGIKLFLLTLSLSFGIFMNVLDVSIANVAIPTIAGNLAVSPNQGTWVITSFSVSQAIMLPLTGWLARRFGEVKLFVISTFLFTVTSLLCGLSANLSMLVFFRVLQGAVSGPMIPLSQSLLLANYGEDRKYLATALWGMVAVVGPIAGPLLGGWLTDQYTWPWIFYINLPIGIFSVGVTWFLLSKRETVVTKTRVDVMGLILLIIGVGCLQILLDNGNDLDWFHSTIIMALAIIAGIALCCLIAWELTDSHPIVDLRLFTNRNFLFGTVALTIGFMIYLGNLVIFPLWLQTQMGYTPTWAGLATAPVGILPFLLMPIVGRYLNNYDPRFLTSVGFVFFAISSFWCTTFYTEINFASLIGPRLVQGLGIAFFFVPLLSVVVSDIPTHRLASALGLANFLRILGGSFGTSLSVTLWDRRESFHHSRFVEHITPFNALTTQATEQLEKLGLPGLKSFEFIDRVVTNQAYMLATLDVFWLSGCIFVSLIAVVWLFKPVSGAKKDIVLAE